MFQIFKNKAEDNKKQKISDDMTYIYDMRRIAGPEPWQQYDVMLAARGYGWVDSVKWADYMASSDLYDIGTVTTALIAGSKDKELIDKFKQFGGKIADFPELQKEQGVLAIGGISRVLKCPVKIVWFNQTNRLRLFTWTADEDAMNRYVETVIRRTFGTKDEMKKAKPLPKER